MTLSEAQRQFTRCLGLLLCHIYEIGWEATLGEAMRTPEQAAIYARQGKGIKQSLHCDRLAIDLNLFRQGKYLDKTEDYLTAGEWWEELGKREGLPLTWGGRFKSRPDGNHFSLSFEGRK